VQRITAAETAAKPTSFRRFRDGEPVVGMKYVLKHDAPPQLVVTGELRQSLLGW